MLYGAMNFPVKHVLDELASVRDLGFDFFELAMDPPEAHHRQIRDQRDALLKALEQAGLRLVCHMPAFVYTADLAPRIREASLTEMMESLEVASELKPLKVVIHPGYMTGLSRYVMDRARKLDLEGLAAIVEKAGELGLTLCLENMFPRTNSMVEPDQFAEVFERFPSLKFTLDTGHASIGSRGGKRAIEFIRRFPDRVHHVHANDNLGKEDNHLPIGAGTVEFEAIARALTEIGYDETVTFEVFSKDRDYLQTSRAKFDAMLKRAAVGRRQG
jgi:sugar phosphate isomerase/epimerase